MTLQNTEKLSTNDDIITKNGHTKTSSLHYFIILFSVVWFGVVAVYITKFFGWDNLFSMVPNEFSGFLAGITLPLAIIWVIMAYIDRGNSYRREAALLQRSVNQLIFPDSDANNATKMIARAIEKQVNDLKEATRDVYAQSDVIRRDLVERINDMRQLSESIHTYSTQSLPNLAEEIRSLTNNFQEVAEKASTTTADFRVNTLQIREDSENLANILTPMVNQMVTAAEHVKEVVNVNNENINKAQEQLLTYSQTSRDAISQIIETWAQKGENLEKTFLRTAENCDDLFRKLDSGVSQIESSISEQKKVVEAQAELLNKNSGYLENKLGEYGKLISLEVEAMVERSGKLENNVQTQMNSLKETASQISDLFTKVGDGIIAKRQMLEIEGSQMVKSINSATERLEEELKALREYYDSTQSKNGEMHKIFAQVASNLQQAETELNNSLVNFNASTDGIADKFKGISEQINKNLDGNFADISAKTESLLEKFNGIGNVVHIGLENSFADISAKTESLLEKFNGIGKTINTSLEQSTSLISAKSGTMVESFGKISSLVDEGLNKTLEEVNLKASNIIGKFSNVGKIVGDDVEKTLENIDIKTNDIIEKFKSASLNVGENVDKLSASAENMTQQSKINATLLIEQDEYVNKSLVSLKQMTGKIAAVNDELSETGQKIGDTLTQYENKLSGFGQTINHHLEKLSANYDKAQKQFEVLEQKYKTTSIDTFMKNSADVISELEALAIDVHGIFNKQGKDEELWKQYYAGDHGVFVRYLSENMTKNEIIAIRQDYENKPDFRVVVDKYIDDFNSLITSARQNNRAGTLLALISGSDIGKVYYVLARALGKLN